MKESAGTLLYRRRDGRLEVLLVRPSGPAARWGWSIPKGLPEPGESLEAAARRETREETGVEPGPLEPLGEVAYSSTRKKVHAFFGEAPADAEPNQTSWEVDVARFVPVSDAAELLHRDQRAFVAMLLSRVAL